jgi:hypothetical protein
MMSNLGGLSNEQIVFIYLRLKKYSDYVNELVLDGYTTQKLVIGFGDMQTETTITDDDLDVILNIPIVSMYMSIEKSLAPIVDIIKESDPDLYDRVNEMIIEAESGNFTDLEEDDEDGSEEDES